MSISFTQFREDMICALYQEQIHNGADDLISFRDLANDHDIDWREGWLLDLQKSLINEGFATGPRNGSNDDMAIGKLIGDGLRYVEEKYGTLDGVPTIVAKRDAQLIVDTEDQEPPFDPETFDPEFFDTGSRIDSQSWTGRTLTQTQRVELVGNIDDALARVDNLPLDQERRAQVRALLIAARTLSEAPEPPLDIIKLLFGNADRIIGIAGFFIGIAGLIVGAA